MSLLTILAFLAVVLLIYSVCGITEAEVDVLTEARKKAGAALIAVRDAQMSADFKDDGTAEEKWKKVNDEYDDAQQKEEAALAAWEKQENMKAVAERVAADSDRIQSRRRGASRLRPDYDPSRDARANGNANRGAHPTAAQWARGLRIWGSARRQDFVMEQADYDVMRALRQNPNADEFHLPSNDAVLALICETQEVFMSHHPERQAEAVREVWASWKTMTPDSAGYLAEPPQVIRTLEVNKLLWGGMLQVATIKNTTTGGDILLPFTDDTTSEGRQIAEDGPIGTERNPKVGLIRWGEYKYTSDIILATFEMMRDSFIGLEEHIGTTGGQRLGRIQNRQFTLGNGVGMPRGIVFSAPVGKTATATNAITTDEVIDLEASVDDAYIQGGTRVGYMMHKNIVTYLRKLKDLEGRPFYILGQETGGRDRLNNKPIYINYHMASALAASADVMLYGDLAKYWIRRVGGTRLVRDPYTYKISRDAEAFAAVEYADGNLVNAGTAPVKKLRMAAA